MISDRLRKTLERKIDLPAMPFMISQLLKALDNPNIRAGKLAELIEKDQSLTTKVLRVANSPFYGFSREIATVELAIVIMGLNSIKEIVISLIVKKLFSRTNSNFNYRQFWEYSLYCGAASRLIARKISYPLAGEAFVAGLVHDLGILVINRFMPKEAAEIWMAAKSKGMSLTEAEKYVLGDTHSEIGAWIVDKWRLPESISGAILKHHIPYRDIDDGNAISPLAAIISLSEWFAQNTDKCEWDTSAHPSTLYLDGKFLSSLTADKELTDRAIIEKLKLEIDEEYDRATAFNTDGGKSLYKN